MKKYLIISFTVSALLFCLFYFGNEPFLEGFLHSEFPALVFFFFLQSLAVGWLLSLGEKSKWETPIYALGAIAFRFLTGLFFLVMLFVMEIPEMKTLMLQFIVLYLGYLIFELYAVLPNLRRN